MPEHSHHCMGTGLSFERQHTLTTAADPLPGASPHLDVGAAIIQQWTSSLAFPRYWASAHLFTALDLCLGNSPYPSYRGDTFLTTCHVLTLHPWLTPPIFLLCSLQRNHTLPLPSIRFHNHRPVSFIFERRTSFIDETSTSWGAGDCEARETQCESSTFLDRDLRRTFWSCLHIVVVELRELHDALLVKARLQMHPSIDDLTAPVTMTFLW